MKRLQRQWLTGISALTLTMSVSCFSYAYASTDTNEAEIIINGHPLTTTPTRIRNHMTWMPMGEVIQALNTLGTDAEFDGHTLLINNLALQSSTLGTHRIGTFNITNCAYVALDVPMMKATSGSKAQPYIPIWYVIQALKQGTPGILASWKSNELNLTNKSPGRPSNKEISRVMQTITEVKTPSEHFVLSGKPVTLSLENGDTLTAAIGMRYPTADGYGQVVFFFHNHQFVGLDSDIEKTEIRSLKPSSTGRPGFDITYANYASSDPLYKPSLPPVTVHFTWDGNTMATEGDAEIPSGAENGIQVQMGETKQSITTNAPTIPDTVKLGIQGDLPKGSTLVNRPGFTSPYLTVDLSGDGQHAYAAVYRKKTPTGNGTALETGLIVGTFKDGSWQTLWNKPLNGMLLGELNAADMTGDGEEEIAVQTYIGDGANDVLVLKLQNGGQLKPVLNVSGTADIGDFNADGKQNVAVWMHDTGPLENIQMYAWNNTNQAYEKAQNADFPSYFAGAPLAYDNMLTRQTGTYANPPKMVDYAFASTYEWAGMYALASARLNDALKQGKDAYPSNQTVDAILNSATTKLKKLKTYHNVPTSVRSMIDKTILKYSNDVSPISSAKPLVSIDEGGDYDVHVIGTFHTLQNGQLKWATELNFTVSKDGSSVHNLLAKDPMGDTVWQAKLNV